MMQNQPDHGVVPTRSSPGRSLVGAWIGAIAVVAMTAALPANAQTRPATLTLVPGVVTFENVQYAADTPADLTQPAAGTARMVVTMGGFTVRREGVTFSSLIFDTQARLQGVVFDLDQKVTTEKVAGCTFEIPSGRVTWRSPDRLSFAGPCVVTFPLRNPDGTPITCSTTSLSAQTSGTTTTMALDSLVLMGPAGANGLSVPGLRIGAAPWNLRVAWAGTAPVTWKVTIPSAAVFAGIPGLATDPTLPVSGQATGVTFNEQGRIDVASATVNTGATIPKMKACGFAFTITGGTFKVEDSVPIFLSLNADVQLPDPFKNAAGTDVAIIRGIGLAAGAPGGLVFDIDQQLDASLLGIKIQAQKMVLDLSSLAAMPNPPSGVDGISLPSWSGIWFKQGTLRLPFGTQSLEVGLDKFYLDATGFSGLTSFDPPNLSLDLQGFKVDLRHVSLGFLRNQITQGSIDGTLKLDDPTKKLDASIQFDLSGIQAIAIDSSFPLDLGLGMKIEGIKGSLAFGAPPMLVLSGTLDLAEPRLRTKITNFRIDSSGQFYMPDEGVLTLPEPAVIDVDVVEVEVRRIGFTCTTGGKSLESISFTGTARLKNPIEGLSLGGEIDLEHLTVKQGPDGPEVEIGGLGLAATIPDLGTIGASLMMSDDLVGFPNSKVLYGDAKLALIPLNGVALNVTFLLAPDSLAWFVGGDAMLPQPIRVDIPPAGGNPPIPLFQVTGFLGGFGMNVKPISSGPGIGPIKEPEKELGYSQGTILGQAGMMIAEYAVGTSVWWADATLTATFNPMMFDMMGRMALLDIGGVTGFPSRSEWKKKDRIASVAVNLDLDSTPTFAIAGDLDMYFPTRDLALVDASGEALMRFSKEDQFMDVGCWWGDCHVKQKALRIRVASAFDDYVDLSGKVGMYLDFGALFGPDGKPLKNAPERVTIGKIKFDTHAKFKTVGVKGTLKGDLTVSRLRNGTMAAHGNLDVKGRADFEVVEATVRGSITADYDGSEFAFDGLLAGSVGCFDGEVPVHRTFP